MMAEQNDLVAAASWIRSNLGEDGFDRWLHETVGALKVVDPRLPEAIGRLKAPILTTNYDRVLETVLSRQLTTWRNVAAMFRVIQGGDDVLHIHGEYSDKDSVVFDDKSYQRLLDDPRNQAQLQIAAGSKHLLFIGVGGGLYDDNLSALRTFLGTVLGPVPHGHYQLVRAADAQVGGAPPPLVADKIEKIGYDGDLADWLDSELAQSPAPGSQAVLPVLPRSAAVGTQVGALTPETVPPPDVSPSNNDVKQLKLHLTDLGLEVPRTSRTGDPLGSFSEKVRARASESTEVLPGVQR